MISCREVLLTHSANDRTRIAVPVAHTSLEHSARGRCSNSILLFPAAQRGHEQIQRTTSGQSGLLSMLLWPRVSLARALGGHRAADNCQTLPHHRDRTQPISFGIPRQHAPPPSTCSKGKTSAMKHSGQG